MEYIKTMENQTENKMKKTIKQTVIDRLVDAGPAGLSWSTLAGVYHNASKNIRLTSLYYPDQDRKSVV